MKTIKQIADELGVSKTAVRKRMSAEVQTKFAQTVSGVIHISSEGETLIKQAFYRNSPQTKFAEVSANQFPQVSGEVSALIAMLQKELDAKNKLINEQQQTINRLTDAIAFAQQTTQVEQALHAGTIQQQLVDGRADQPEANTSSGLFARILSRKR